MKIVSIRMSEDTWEAIQAESVRAGISASEFIREASLFRLGWRWAHRSNNDEILKRLRAIGALRKDF